MHGQVKPWQVALGGLTLLAILFGIGSRALRPAPIRSQAPAGVRPIHYEIEVGPRPGLLEDLKRAGAVPQDAIDDGRGRFVSPSELSVSERALAERIVRERAFRRSRNTEVRRR